MQKKSQIDHPWDRAAGLSLTRGSPFGVLEPIDPGVNFFVLALESLGAKPKFSCEGHPSGFYVAFQAPYELAAKIKTAGFFTVEIEGDGYWSIRKRLSERVNLSSAYSEGDKARTLRWATQAWITNFGEELKKSAELAAVINPTAAETPEPQGRSDDYEPDAPPKRRSVRPR